MTEKTLYIELMPQEFRERLSDDPDEFPLGTGPDDARESTAEHGQVIVNHQVERMSAILMEALTFLAEPNEQ